MRGAAGSGEGAVEVAKGTGPRASPAASYHGTTATVLARALSQPEIQVNLECGEKARG
jgi:hypothetical protein